VLRLDALLAQATIQLGRFTLKAPMRGTVITAAVDMGQLVDPSSPLFTLADVSALVVEASVDETYASQIKSGQTAMLQLIGTRDVLAGKVAFVAPRVDGATGGLAIKLAFDTPVHAAVGLTVTANILVDQRPALTVPRSALQEGGVFLLQNGAAHWTGVTTIEWPADRLIVTKGIAAGDVVIVTAEGITQGQRASAATGAN
jgi:RND family efflux transporter MFP subunit